MVEKFFEHFEVQNFLIVKLNKIVAFWLRTGINSYVI